MRLIARTPIQKLLHQKRNALSILHLSVSAQTCIRHIDGSVHYIHMLLLLTVSVTRTNLECLRKEGDFALSKQRVPGFSQRQETAAPLPTRGAEASLDPEQSDQHGELGVPSHKGRADMCRRRLLTKHLRCKIRRKKISVNVSNVPSAADVT